MFKSNIIAGAMVLALPAAAQTQSNPDLDEIRKQIQELKESYESRIQALEKRLKDAEEREGAARAQSEARQAGQASKPATPGDQTVAAPLPPQHVIDNEVFVQYIMSLGSHGAHKF